MSGSPGSGGSGPDRAVPGRGAAGLLHTPFRLGPLHLRNRIVFTAHLTDAAEDGLPTAQHAAYYAARAAGGAGLIITEEHSVHRDDRPYEKLIRGGDPAALPGYRMLTDAVHAHGVPVLAQLNHNGGQSSGRYSRRPVRAPSPIADPLFREVPVEITVAEIAELVASYARTARLCADGGFDGVELQCSHASILRQFLSPLTNRRTDRYGGSIENRSRIVREVAAAVREAVGRGRVVGVRLCGDEGLAGGTPVEEAVATAQLLERDGTIDHVNTAVGVATATLHLIEPPMTVAPGYALHVPAAIRRAVALPVLGVGRFTTHAHAEAALADGHCDLVGVVRAQVADPGWATLPRRPCVGCNQECIGRVGRNQRLGCLVEPRTGREGSSRVGVGPVPEVAGGSAGSAGSVVDGAAGGSVGGVGSAAGGSAGRTGPGAPGPAVGVAGRCGGAVARPVVVPLGAPVAVRRVLVVGGGPAGLEAAATAAGRGHRVVLCERADATGGQLALAATAPGRGELAGLTDALRAACERAGVDLRTGVPVTLATVAEIAPDAVVLATGSTPARPDWPGSGRHVVDACDVLSGRARPRGRVVVVDGTGFREAPSAAELLAAAGAEVMIVSPALVVAQDLATTLDMERFHRRAAAAGITLRSEHVVLDVVEDAGELVLRSLHHPTGEEVAMRCDAVVAAVPRRADDTLWRALGAGSRPAFAVHRIGDCLAPRRADAAVRDGRRIGEQL